MKKTITNGIILLMALCLFSGCNIGEKSNDIIKDKGEPSQTSLSDSPVQTTGALPSPSMIQTPSPTGEQIEATASPDAGRTLIENHLNILSAGMWHTVALRKDGTVIAIGINENYQCEVNEWTDIVSVYAGDGLTFGIKKDGSLMATPAAAFIVSNEDISALNDIIAVAASPFNFICLHIDGTVSAFGDNSENQCDVGDWNNIIDIATYGGHTVGLKSDGTVMAIGLNDYNQCDVSGWTDIIDIEVGPGATFGLKKDGTVLAVGMDELNQLKVSGWTDIKDISTGAFLVIGLKKDGTVVATGSNTHEQLNVGEWNDIVAIDAGYDHVVGLKSDGTVVATGTNHMNQCMVDEMEDIG